jgi:putative transposase
MAQIPRVVVPGLPHHVTQRGNRREPVFVEADDYRLYRRMVALRRRGAPAQPSGLIARCPITSNLIVTPVDADGLRATFAEAHRRYSGAINARFRWTGHLFQGRFGAVAMGRAPFVASGALHRVQSGGRRVGEPCRGLAMVEHSGAARGR